MKTRPDEILITVLVIKLKLMSDSRSPLEVDLLISNIQFYSNFGMVETRGVEPILQRRVGKTGGFEGGD